jgi:hypothetical protein
MRIFLTISAVGALAVAAVSAAGTVDPAAKQHTRLLARSVLPAATYRAGSPASGALFSESDRSSAAANGIAQTGIDPSYFANQPLQGISAVIPDGRGTWWILSDNGYGSRANSPDWQLVVNRVDPRFGRAGAPEILETIALSDPNGHVPWKIVCDPARGTDLPPFDFNQLPAVPLAACGSDAKARLLTGFDFDLESMQIAEDGTFWFGEEFGPFLLHADREGRLLQAPIPVPGYKSPQNPTLNVTGGEQPNVATSRGFEGMAISPDRRYLYPLLEGPVTDDDPQDLRILEFDIDRREYTGRVMKIRLEMPGTKVNLASLKLASGSPAYPGTAAPPAGSQAVGELTAINRNQFLLLERDNHGDGLPAPRFKKIFLLDTRKARAGAKDKYVAKSLLVDLMAVPDPLQQGGDGDYFRFPFVTIESVHPIDDGSIVVVNDNNFPFSNGRSRSKTNERTGPLAADDNEFIRIGFGTPLKVDTRLLNLPEP